MDFPTWLDSTHAFNTQTATPLHIFIREFEPVEDVEDFRKLLQEAIYWAIEEGKYQLKSAVVLPPQLF